MLWIVFKLSGIRKKVSFILIAKAVDLASDRHENFYSWSSASSNKSAARAIVKGWASVLVNALDEAHGKTE